MLVLSIEDTDKFLIFLSFAVVRRMGTAAKEHLTASKNASPAGGTTVCFGKQCQDHDLCCENKVRAKTITI